MIRTNPFISQKISTNQFQFGLIGCIFLLISVNVEAQIDSDSLVIQNRNAVNALFEKAKAGKHEYIDSISDNHLSLKGRKLVIQPKLIDDSQKEGKVVVNILVTPAGDVIQATVDETRSTSDNHLMKLSTVAVLGAKFNADSLAPIQQKGEMTFLFVLE